VSKYKSLRTVMDLIHVLGGGLEPAFRVLFSAVFHGFPSGISIRVANCGKEWNQNCSFFVVKLPAKFSCVLAIAAFHGDLKNPRTHAFRRFLPNTNPWLKAFKSSYQSPRQSVDASVPCSARIYRIRNACR
jgi:hypothetical protein